MTKVQSQHFIFPDFSSALKKSVGRLGIPRQLPQQPSCSTAAGACSTRGSPYPTVVLLLVKPEGQAQESKNQTLQKSML